MLKHGRVYDTGDKKGYGRIVVASESVARLLTDGGHNYSATMIIPASSDLNLMNKGSLDPSHHDESNVSCIVSLGSIDAEI
uniref:Uncharacterized protein n=1 Tax=Rhizophagus irregularis (strain DAOM 181602 / DAOM 197198 / MUCL 43194) TaxID=747089 RepID=U9UAV2_RHIID